MVKLQHQTRRDGGISVRGTRYELDASGCVEVPEEHAAVMLQGSKWKMVGASSPGPAAPAAPPPVEERSLQDMTKDELFELAQGMDLEVDSRMSKLKLATAIRKARKER